MLPYMHPVVAARPLAAEQIAEFLRDPVLTVACVLLIVVSIGWIIVTRLIVRSYRKALLGISKPSPQVEAIRPPRDIWSIPP